MDFSNLLTRGEKANSTKGGKPDTCNGQGSPVWSVNPINLNLFVTDTPIWHKPPYGPSVDIQVSYNSLTQTVPDSPFGPKWQFKYSSYIIENPAGKPIGSVMVVMPDGREDLFINESGVYKKPIGISNTLANPSSQRYTLSFLDGTVHTYSVPAGMSRIVLTEIKDAHSQSLHINYDSGRISSIVDALGHATTFGYNAQGLVETVTDSFDDDPLRKPARFEYYTNGELKKVTDMADYWAEFTYETVGSERFLSGITKQNGTWGFRTEPSDGATNAAAYPDPNAAPPKMGNKYRLTITNPDNPDGTKNKEEYYYFGQHAWYVSPRDYVEYVPGDATNNNYAKAPKTLYFFNRSFDQEGQLDRRGQLDRVRTPQGALTKYTYYTDPAAPGYGLPETVTDGHTHATRYEYNAKGRITSITDPRQKQTTFTYHPNNLDVHYVTNGLGSIAYEYNGVPHVVTDVIDRMGVRTKFDYDGFGRLAAVTEAKDTALQIVTNLEYDPVRQTLKELRKSGNLLGAFDHDDIGRLTSATYADGVTVSYEYERLNQIKTIKYPDSTPEGSKTERVVNSTVCPFLVDSVTDRGGITTSYVYDSLKRLKELTGPNGTYKYEYDPNGNLTVFTDADQPNKQTTFTYNLDNRLIQKTYADGKFVKYLYDSDGLLNNFINGRNQIITYAYDANHNLTGITYPSGTPGVSFTYDDYNRVQTRTDGIGAWAYTYDANNRLKTMRTPWDTADSIVYDYDDLGRLKTMTPLGGAQVTYGYTDPLGRLKTITRGSDVFTYNYVGNSSLIQSLLRPRGGSVEYQYNDPLKRLTQVVNKNPLQQIINQYDYTYNTLDLKGTETITSGVPIDNFVAQATSYTYNDVNQLLNKTNPEQTFAHDDDGNMTTAFTPEGYQMTLGYDAANRLTSAQYTGSANKVYKTTYEYSGDSLLSIVKKFENNVLMNTIRYIRAGFLPIQERNGNNAVTREYLWGKNMGGGIGGLLGLRQSSNDYYYLYDGKGNVSTVIDATETPVATYTYDPFGVVMKKTGTLDQPYQFSTKEYDPQTGLSYYGYRFYSARLGRWINRDPLGEEGGINLYGFVQNNPVNWVDPFGLAKSGVEYTWEDCTASEVAQCKATCESQGKEYGSCKYRHRYMTSIRNGKEVLTVKKLPNGLSCSCNDKDDGSRRCPDNRSFGEKARDAWDNFNDFMQRNTPNPNRRPNTPYPMPFPWPVPVPIIP